MSWEFAFLHGLQSLHCAPLNTIMIFLSTIGNAGIIWILLAVVLLCFPKWRRCGALMLLSMAVSFILGNLVLKNLIARARPCAIDITVPLLVKFPKEYSFPSGHTLNGFTAAVMIFLHNRKAGIGALILAAAIAFSRMYLFVHFPTDILGGMVLGIADAVVVYLIVKRIEQKGKNIC